MGQSKDKTCDNNTQCCCKLFHYKYTIKKKRSASSRMNGSSRVRRDNFSWRRKIELCCDPGRQVEADSDRPKCKSIDSVSVSHATFSSTHYFAARVTNDERIIICTLKILLKWTIGHLTALAKTIYECKVLLIVKLINERTNKLTYIVICKLTTVKPRFTMPRFTGSLDLPGFNPHPQKHALRVNQFKMYPNLPCYAP